MLKTIAKISIMSLFVLGATSAMACESMGPNAHMGQVTAVDTSKGTFTIKDAESNSPITFSASSDIINGLKDAKGMVKVNYEEQGEILTALGVTF